MVEGHEDAEDETVSGPSMIKVRGDLVIDSEGKVHSIREAADQLPWVDATKYPSPHQYCIQRKSPALPWRVLELAIRDHPDSYLAYFRGYKRPMRYWEFEGRRYWRTASRDHGGLTQMLNRCTFDSVEPPRRVDQGATALPWGDGPPWEPFGSPWAAD